MTPAQPAPPVSLPTLVSTAPSKKNGPIVCHGIHQCAHAQVLYSHESVIDLHADFLTSHGVYNYCARLQVLYSQDEYVTDPILAAVGQLQFEVRGADSILIYLLALFWMHAVLAVCACCHCHCSHPCLCENTTGVLVSVCLRCYLLSTLIHHNKS